jgi:UDP-glucose 4-epimerase
MIVYKETQSLKPNIVTPDTRPVPNAVYGDSKLKAEMGLQELECPTFKVCIPRPPMIYGPNSKSNLLRLGALGTKLPMFPSWQNKRSMLYIDNLSEFVKHVILRDMFGIYYPQNKEFGSTVEIVRFFAKKYNHKIWFSKIFNPFVWIGSFFLQPLNKMFASYYYDPEMSKMDFEYQLVSQDKSFECLEITEANRHM